LFVLVDLGLPAGRHKPAVKIATMPFPVAANRKNPCLKRLPNRMVFSGIHGVVIGHKRRRQSARCVGRESALTWRLLDHAGARNHDGMIGRSSASVWPAASKTAIGRTPCKSR
jgi:hypothetical protein